jgi:hypothetical protein
MQTIDKQVVGPAELESKLGNSLRAQGAEAAVLVMLGGIGAGTNAGFWSRVVMLESNGVWLMELIHGLTNFKDLYHFNNDVDPPERAIGRFDEMSASSQTHPTAFTKNEFGWLDNAAIRLHSGSSAQYSLRHLALSQPPVEGQVAAVRVGGSVPYVMVESRKKTDQFDSGITSEGVIAYRVQTRNPTIQEREGNKKPLFLITLTALRPGMSAELDHGVRLNVIDERPDGFNVRIDLPEDKVTVPNVIGANLFAAVQTLRAAGLMGQFSGPVSGFFGGSSKIKVQSPNPGDVVQKGSIVRLRLKIWPF